MIWLLIACRTATIVDACEGAEADTGLCLPCSDSADCGITGNPCLETAYCAHDDAAIAAPDLGCSSAIEYRWPSDEACGCVDGLCKTGE